MREAYREGMRDPVEVSRRIVHALDADTLGNMSGPGVGVCLDTLLEGARSASLTPPPAYIEAATGAMDVAGILRQTAERRLAVDGYASRFADIALDALGASTLLAVSSATGDARDPVSRLAESYTGHRLHALTQGFLGSDLDRCFRYFVSRDIGEFVGTEAYRTVADAREFVARVGAHCRMAATGVPLAGSEGQLQDALRSQSAGERLTSVQRVMSGALHGGLDIIEQGSRGAPRERAPRRSQRDSRPGAEDDAEASTRIGGLRLVEESERRADRRYLPVYSLQAAAGYFGDGEDVGHLGFVESPPGIRINENTFVARVAGRSMEPRIPDGSYAIFQAPVVGSRQGKIVLAQKWGYHDPDTGGSYTVKRYESTKLVTPDGWHHVGVRLTPENPEYEVIEIGPEEAEGLVIIAQFVALLE